MIIERIATGPWNANCYAAHNGYAALLVDPGGDPQEILLALRDRSLSIVAMVATHGHFDHVAAAAEITEATGAPLWISRADDDMLAAGNLHSFATGHGKPVTRPVVLNDLDGTGRTLPLDPFEIGVLKTPGHTPGSVCFLVGDALFTGDTLLANGVAQSRLPGADAKELKTSIERISQWADPGLTVMYPGHGPSCRLANALAALESASAR